MRRLPKKRSTVQTPAEKPETTAESPVCKTCAPEIADEHRVLSHLFYLLFIGCAALAFVFTLGTFSAEWTASNRYIGVQALAFLGWAFLFKTLAHRVHPPHH